MINQYLKNYKIFSVRYKVNDKIVNESICSFGTRVRQVKDKKDKITFLFLTVEKEANENKHFKHEFMFNYYFIIKPCNYARGKDIHRVSFDFDFTSYVPLYISIVGHS